MITEVQITEASVETFYAQHCPSGQNVQQFLVRLVEDIVLAPSNMRKVRVAGTVIEIDRHNVTSVTVTRDAN